MFFKSPQICIVRVCVCVFSRIKEGIELNRKRRKKEGKKRLQNAFLIFIYALVQPNLLHLPLMLLQIVALSSLRHISWIKEMLSHTMNYNGSTVS